MLTLAFKLVEKHPMYSSSKYGSLFELAEFSIGFYMRFHSTSNTIKLLKIHINSYFQFYTFNLSNVKWSYLGQLLYDPKPNPNLHSRNSLLAALSQKGNDFSDSGNLIHFYTILDTFMWFSYTFIRSWTLLCNPKLNIFIFFNP